MARSINYNQIFEQAFQEIRMIRDPHASSPEYSDLKWNDIQKEVLFDFGGKEFTKYSLCMEAARKISLLYLKAIIQNMLKINGYPNDEIDVPKERLLNTTQFAIKEDKTRTLLLFKDIEESAYWKIKDCEPQEVSDLLSKEKLLSYKYIYLVYDYAYLQVISHNSDVSDSGRGYNVYSIKYFFEYYFGKEEADIFINALQKYTFRVKDYLGFIFVKSLTPNALVNFRKNVEAELIQYPYDIVLKNHICKNNLCFSMPVDGYKLISEQYIDKQTFLLMLGTANYAESLLTAEWLFDSMKKAKAVDYTIIGTGYFKSVEQLLFKLICLHRNEGRQIQRDPSRKDLPPRIVLDDGSIENKAVDSTLGAMANYYKENMDVLRPELPKWSKTYIKEAIFTYKDLRNGYLHKDNIHDWDEIIKIRNKTYELFFLLLGAQLFTKQELAELGMPERSCFDDYSKLCEYINFHSGEMFFITIKDEIEDLFIGRADPKSTTINDSYVQYSGVYFSDLGKDGRQYVLSRDHLPKRITLAKFVYEKGVEKISISPIKVKVIFENGKFVGPPIASEERLEY